MQSHISEQSTKQHLIRRETLRREHSPAELDESQNNIPESQEVDIADNAQNNVSGKQNNVSGMPLTSPVGSLLLLKAKLQQSNASPGYDSGSPSVNTTLQHVHPGVYKPPTEKLYLGNNNASELSLRNPCHFKHRRHCP